MSIPIFKFKTSYKKILVDTITPVSIYLKIRDVYPNAILLESSDYQTNNNSFSYICSQPIAGIKVQNNQIVQEFPNGLSVTNEIKNRTEVLNTFTEFTSKFSVEPLDFKFITNGLFGYVTYNGVQYFEDISLEFQKDPIDIPELYYAVYQNVIAINHYQNEAYLFCHSLEGKDNTDEIFNLIQNRNIATYSFSKIGNAQTNYTDDQFKDFVRKAKDHCQRGDVFQLVFSRRFMQKFKGDEFNVYRALRSINPSPYLFYFDYGNFKIMGSSPEAQMVIQKNVAEIHPIAGTFKRTGNDEQDADLVRQLHKDPKENAEHVMLVDLARNDLSRHCTDVKVEVFKEVQFFSHVIHLVSKVIGKVKSGNSAIQIFADTFPAGTLTGAPKYKAMQLIAANENVSRSFYGGAVGFMDFNGNFNHAILIRTFLSKNQQLFYQAGAGIVVNSSEENELQEVYNKLSALDKALSLAEKIN
jgi:anthranilate synthase component 1